MIKEKDGFNSFLLKVFQMYKKFQNEIIKDKIKGLPKEFKEGLNYYEEFIKNKKEISNENQDKILKLIIMTLSVELANNTIETSLEAIEIISENNYFSKEIIDQNINNFGKNILSIYTNYQNNVKIIMQLINLLNKLIESQNFILKNESLYNIIYFLTLNIIQINSSDNKTSTYQIRKLAKLVLKKYIEKIISKSTKITYDFENSFNYKYFVLNYLNKKLYINYISQLIEYYIDNILEQKIKTARSKNEKGIDKGEYNWCFNCRNEANYFSDNLSLPICSKKCENTIIYTEKLLNKEIYYNSQNYSIFDDYINIIKIITSNALYFLELYLFNDKIIKNFHKELLNMDDKLNYFIEIVYNLLSQPIIKDSDHNKYILDLFKEYIFPFLIEIFNFYKRANNLNGYKNSMKIFEIIITDFDDWYIENLKIEIYIFSKNIIFPYFSDESHNDDFINDSNNHLNYLEIKNYLLEYLNTNLKEFFFELHINYDENFYFDNIFINIIRNITNILYDSYDKKFIYESNTNIDLIHKIKKNSFNFIINLILQIEEYANELISNNQENENKINGKKRGHMLNLKNILDKGVEIFCSNPSSTINYFLKNETIPQAKEYIIYKETYINNDIHNRENKNIAKKTSEKEKRYKFNLSYFPQLFKNESNIIKENDIDIIFYDYFRQYFSMSINYDDFTAYILAFFIKLKFDKIMAINKLIISNFFSSFSSLSIKVLNYYISNFNFKNYSILEALHLLFNYLPLINKKQIVEKIIQIFSNKFVHDNFNLDEDECYSDNKHFVIEYFIKLCQMILEISNSILEENNVKKQITKKKLKTINEYLESFKKDFKYFKDIDKMKIMNNSFIYDIYNLTLNNPINLYFYPNINSLIDSNGIIKSNNELYGVFPTELFKLEILIDINDDNIFILKKNSRKENIRNIINDSWEFFLGIFSKHIAYYDDIEYILKAIENILVISKTSGMLKLDTISNAFLNSVINLTGLSETLYQKLHFNNIIILKTLLSYIQKYGKYIYSSWYSIFRLLSRINILKKCNPDLMYTILGIKNLEIKKFIESYNNNAKLVESINIELIYTITKEFSDETLKKFVTDLIKVSNEELNLFKNEKSKKTKERFFSFNKLVYIIDINRERWKNKENIEIYEIVKIFFVKLISENPLEDILLNKIKDSFKIVDDYKK